MHAECRGELRASAPDRAEADDAGSLPRQRGDARQERLFVPGLLLLLQDGGAEVTCEREAHAPEVLAIGSGVDVHVGDDRGVRGRFRCAASHSAPACRVCSHRSDRASGHSRAEGRGSRSRFADERGLRGKLLAADQAGRARRSDGGRLLLFEGVAQEDDRDVAAPMATDNRGSPRKSSSPASTGASHVPC